MSEAWASNESGSSGPILPGKTLGVIGGGQLGRMFSFAAKQMGYRVHVYTQEPDSPAGQVSDREYVGDLSVCESFRAFVDAVDVVTYETENIPAELVEYAEQGMPARPHSRFLRVAQNRLIEKSELAAIGLQVPRFFAVANLQDFEEGLAALAGVGVLKSSTGGYDGRSQWLINQQHGSDVARQVVARQTAADDVMAATTAPFILEELIDLTAEFSIVAARGVDGEFRAYPPVLNVHRHHILDVSTVPSGLSATLESKGLEAMRRVAEHYEVVGLFCIEFFVSSDDRVLINEIAPRPHNSGHLTIEASVTSQFQQQVRAMTGLPLGNATVQPAAMVNLLGDLWTEDTPDWAAALALEKVALHLYGKAEARPKRKMGHLTALGDDVSKARSQALAARDAVATARKSHIA